MKQSEAYSELIRVFKNWNPDEEGKSSIKKKFPDAFESLYEKKINYEQLLNKKKYAGDVVKLSKDLNKLKEEIIKFQTNKRIKSEYLLLAETESLIELGLFEKARENLEKVWSKPSEIAYYKKWQLIDLETKITTPLEEYVGYRHNFLASIKSIAMSGTHITNEAWQRDFPNIDDSKLTEIIEFFRNYNDVKILIEEIQTSKMKAWQFGIDESSNEIRTFEFNKNHFQIKLFFEKCFTLLSKIIKNPFLLEDDSEIVKSVLKEMNDMVHSIKTGSIQFGPNILTVFFQNEAKKLELSLLCLPKSSETFEKSEIHPHFLFDPIELKEELIVYDILIDILLFDGFEHDLTDVHIENLMLTFHRLQTFLDGRIDLIHSKTTKTGLMCIYVLFAKCLRAQSKKQLNLRDLFTETILQEKMSETRFKEKLFNEDFYKELITKKRSELMPRPIPRDLLQLACLKLHENLPE